MEGKDLESGRELGRSKADYTWWYSVSSLYSLGPQRHTLGLWSLWTAHNIVEALQGKNSKPEELSEHKSIYM